MKYFARHRAARVALAAIGPFMLTFGVPFANRIEPRIFGLPFILAWIVFWVLATPFTLYFIYRAEGHR